MERVGGRMMLGCIPSVEKFRVYIIVFLFFCIDFFVDFYGKFI